MAYHPYNTIYRPDPNDSDYLIQRAFECMSWMPAVMEQADKLDALSCQTPKVARRGQRAVADLLRLTAKLDQNLAEWHSEIASSIKHPVHVPVDPINCQNFPRENLVYNDPGDCYIWILYWGMILYLDQLIKQLQVRHATLAKLFPNPIPLPVELAELGRSYSNLDRIAADIAGSLSSGFKPSLFTAQETTVSVFAILVYYGVRGDSEKVMWCIKMLKTIESQGLTMSLQVKQDESRPPSVLALFLADQERNSKRAETASPPRRLVELHENLESHSPTSSED